MQSIKQNKNRHAIQREVLKSYWQNTKNYKLIKLRKINNTFMLQQYQLND